MFFNKKNSYGTIFVSNQNFITLHVKLFKVSGFKNFQSQSFSRFF